MSDCLDKKEWTWGYKIPILVSLKGHCQGWDTQKVHLAQAAGLK